MRKLDGILIAGVITLSIVLIAFYYFLQYATADSTSNNEQFVNAIKLFYKVFHSIFALVLLATGFFGYQKFEQLNRIKSVVLLSVLLLLGVAPFFM